MSQWYVVRAATRREADAAEALNKAGFPAMLPCETVKRKIGREKKLVRRPIFRDYLFVLCAPERVAEVCATNYVHDVLRMRGRGGDPVPCAIPATIVRDLFHMDFFGALDRTQADLAVWRPRRDDQVRIEGGSFAALGYVGRILSVTTDQRQAVVLLSNGFTMTANTEHLAEVA